MRNDNCQNNDRNNVLNTPQHQMEADTDTIVQKCVYMEKKYVSIAISTIVYSVLFRL
ncbi:hypothetical protein HT594_00131 [Phenacoccus solenopsis nudivirus]|nr:hypothetical protein HT594_00131 [Phenacoccus solenopsis nudivirus]